MNNKIATYERWKYPRTQFHSDISRANAIKYAPEQKEEKSDFMKKWWAWLDLSVREEIKRQKKESSKRGSKSPHWKWGSKGVCEMCQSETSRKNITKCQSCYHKKRIVNFDENGERTYRAKGKCVECGKTTCNPERKMCSSCSHKWERSLFWRWWVTKENTRIRLSVEYKLWKDAVMARDNYTCQKTGKRSGDMEVHHIQNFSQYPELRLAIDNGITLSKKAHKEFHDIYGKQNNNKEQLIQFLTI